MANLMRHQETPAGRNRPDQAAGGLYKRKRSLRWNTVGRPNW
jgi:hypothetical protein